MLIVGLIVAAGRVQPMTLDFLHLKRRFYPGKVAQHLDYVLSEVKGSEIRKEIRSDSRRKRRHGFGLLDAIVDLMECHDVGLVGRVWVKEPTKPLKQRASYTFAVQDIARHFNHFLDSERSSGLVLCDARWHKQDVEVAHSIFTQKYKVEGDAFPQLVEAAMFGRSENHAGLQLADLVASALLFPMAVRAYRGSSPPSVHNHPRYDALRTRYASRLKARQYVYSDGQRTRGGMVVSDPVGQMPSSELFEEPTQFL